MTAALFVVAFACLSLIVWATPGVMLRHRVDVALRDAAFRVAQLRASFERLGLAFAEAASAVERLAASFNSSLSVDTSYPQESPVRETGRDGQAAVPRLREGFPPGTTSDPDPNGIGPNSPG